ncbi:MAG: aldehyde dehydrogenase family protein, partial [Pseudomonadota bacterium]
VLHLATFKSGEIDDVIDRVNATGYGLTFGLMTRIDDRVQHVTERVRSGNLYVNRNQIGAIVGSQPFGGEGLSGTGPKAGGPHYLARFTSRTVTTSDVGWDAAMPRAALQDALAKAAQKPVAESRARALPGPTGESNLLSTSPRLPILCLGPGPSMVARQAALVEALGGRAALARGDLEPETLTNLDGFGGVIWWGNETQARAFVQALAKRPGAILPLITGEPDVAHVMLERHVCVDTTAAGGNAALLGGMS